MKRLIEKGLMFGNLFHVESPALVERYNRALAHLTGKTTTLSDFHIDISGYSPEVGDALGDHLYLNQGGVNRQFILLSTQQQRCPLLNAKFSTSRDILREFVAANEAQLFALTATDAVAGELVNSVFQVTEPAELFKIRKIEVEADTPGGRLKHADRLGHLAERFQTGEDAWFNDELIAEMIDLAEKSGDVTRNPVRLSKTEFEQRNFWTALFGGLYVFQDVDHPATITPGDRKVLGTLPTKYKFDFSQRNQIAKFLDYNDLAEPIVRARGLDAVAILQQKMDFIVIDAAAGQGYDLTGLDRTAMRRLARQNSAGLPPEYHGLAELLNWAEGNGPWPKISSDHPSYFYTLRASDTGDQDLVNMLLSHLAPLDIRQLFICHKELFYALYATWPEDKKAYAAGFLEREYQVDKAGARAALFGHEPGMDNAAPVDPAEMIRRVGPWGAVRR